MLTKAERNADVARAYVDGLTVLELSERFHLTTERVRQILRKSAVYQGYRDKHREKRPAFLGVNLTEETKDALQVKADEQGTSMSRLVSDTIEEMVK